MEKAKNNKTKTTVIATALALVLALGGTIAWLVSADGTVRNEFDPNRVKVELTETGTDENGVNDSFDIIPGTEQPKDPKISATADCPAYVYAIVKDNTHDLVDYEIAEGWTEATGLTKVVTGKDKDGNEISIDPTAEGVTVYYREVSGTDEDFEHGPWSVLKGDKVSYSSDLTNEDMYSNDGTTPKYDDISLVFSAYAVQKTPFNDPAKAWNQEVQVTGVTISGDDLEDGALTLEAESTSTLTAATTPAEATPNTVTWTSSDETVATVDENGVVTAVAAGTATITATSDDNPSVSDSITVTVTPKETVTGNIKLAMQLHSNDGTTVEFWPAMGTNTYGSKCSGEHCIHNDSWEEIKAHPENYTQCITAGCTKTVTIDETSNSAIFNGSHGSEAGMLNYNELNSEACMWSSTGSNSNPTYPDTLAAIKAGSDIPSGATMKLLSMADLGNPALYTPDNSRVIYDSAGNAYHWWLADPNTSYDYYAYGVYDDGRIVDYDSVNRNYGIAPGFSY